jgi:hypothetical protein
LLTSKVRIWLKAKPEIHKGMDKNSYEKLDTDGGITWGKVIASREKRSALSLWWNSSRLVMEIGAVDSFTQQFERIANSMYKAPFSQQLYAIYLMDEMFNVMPESSRQFVKDIIQCIATEIENVLRPIPDDATLEAFCKSYAALQSNTFGKNTTLREIAEKQRGMVVKSEGDISSPNIDSDQELIAAISRELKELRKKYEKYPLLAWFVATQLVPVSKGEFQIFEVDWARKQFMDMCMAKAHMRWSTLGWVYVHLVEQGVHTEIALGTQKRYQFEKLIVQTIPQASVELAHLSSVLRKQEAVNEGLKTRFLAFGSVLAFATVDFSKRYLLKVLFKESDEEVD